MVSKMKNTNKGNNNEKQNEKQKNQVFETLLEEARQNDLIVKMEKDIALIKAVEVRDKKKIAEHIMNGAAPTAKYPSHGFTEEATTIAKNKSDYELLRFMIEKVIEYFEMKGNAKDEKEKLDKVLILAPEARLSLDKVAKLIELGSRPDAQYENFENKQSAFIKSAITGNIVMAEYFRKYVKNISHADADEKSALMHAMAYKHDDIRFMILEHLGKYNRPNHNETKADEK